jgi:hypothetical protein
MRAWVGLVALLALALTVSSSEYCCVCRAASVPAASHGNVLAERTAKHQRDAAKRHHHKHAQEPLEARFAERAEHHGKHQHHAERAAHHGKHQHHAERAHEESPRFAERAAHHGKHQHHAERAAHRNKHHHAERAHEESPRFAERAAHHGKHQHHAERAAHHNKHHRAERAHEESPRFAERAAHHGKHQHHAERAAHHNKHHRAERAHLEDVEPQVAAVPQFPGDELRALQASNALRGGSTSQDASFFSAAQAKAKLIAEARKTQDSQAVAPLTHVDDGSGIGVPPALAPAQRQEPLPPTGPLPMEDSPQSPVPALASEDTSSVRFEENLYGTNSDASAQSLSAPSELDQLAGPFTREGG